MYKLVDFNSGNDVMSDGLVFSGKNIPWEVMMDIDSIGKKINRDDFVSRTPCMSKYLPFMPIRDAEKFVTLGEGGTPLIKSRNLGKQFGIDLYFKVEGKNPTGSFKDRGSVVDITVAREFKAKGIVLASIGNMAASCCCYAAAAKIPCFVIIPEGISSAKLAHVLSFGGKVVQIRGSYQDAVNLAYSLAQNLGFYLAGNYAFRVEGQKTAAFEIIDQLSFQAPDVVIVPMGAGTNIASYAKGFDEYVKFGLIEKSPKLVGVQAEGANVVVRSYEKKSFSVVERNQCNTIASAIAVDNPIDGVKALFAINKTGGEAGAVTDREILKAQYLLAKEEGLFVESASATTLAYLMRKNKRDALRGQKVVCVLTGEGLKELDVIVRSTMKPPTIYPEVSEFFRLYKSRTFSRKMMVFFGDNQVLFNRRPTDKNLRRELKRLFGVHYKEMCLPTIRRTISSFLQKGKLITILDLKEIVQNAGESIGNDKEKVLSVEAFKVIAGKEKMPHATVAVRIANVECEFDSRGVGPVDAVIKALCKACKGKIDFNLLDYKVKMREQRTDAVIYVELTLVKGHFVSLGRAASLDIIQASIRAFEDAYNGLWTNSL